MLSVFTREPRQGKNETNIEMYKRDCNESDDAKDLRNKSVYDRGQMVGDNGCTSTMHEECRFAILVNWLLPSRLFASFMV